MATNSLSSIKGEDRRTPVQDIEKQEPQLTETNNNNLFRVSSGEVYSSSPNPEKEEHSHHPKWYQRLLDTTGAEENGIKPVPLSQRTNRQYSNLFTMFFTCLLCLLPIPTGMLATLVFGMSLRDSALVILFFALITCVPPAFMATGGANTGLRQQVQARYSFGLYLATIPLLLNAATVTGFSLVSAIVGGQAIASLSPSTVSVNVGIVIVSLISFAASFMGYKTLHLWERWTWIPSLISLVVAVGCGGKYLHLQSEVPASTVQQVLSYGGLVAGYFLTFGGTVSDYSVYHDPRGASKTKIFLYTYLGLALPSIPLLILGAAIGGAVPQVPSWSSAYAISGVGGVFYEMLTPAGGFGKFIVVLLALSVIGNIAISMYSVALNLQLLVSPLFSLFGAPATRVPRFVWTVVVFAVMIPMSVKAAEEWETSLENFLALIGYYAGCFDAVLIVELVVFRRMDWGSYDHAIWNKANELPTGLAAVGASALSFALVIPGMAEVWYTGPIAKCTGDIGFELAFVLTGLFYLPLRWLEIRVRGHL